LAEDEHGSRRPGKEARDEQAREVVVAGAQGMLEDTQGVAVRGHATVVAVKVRLLTRR
jgi:hypothetical protein